MASGYEKLSGYMRNLFGVDFSGSSATPKHIREVIVGNGLNLSVNESTKKATLTAGSARASSVRTAAPGDNFLTPSGSTDYIVTNNVSGPIVDLNIQTTSLVSGDTVSIRLLAAQGSTTYISQAGKTEDLFAVTGLAVAADMTFFVRFDGTDLQRLTSVSDIVVDGRPVQRIATDSTITVTHSGTGLDRVATLSSSLSLNSVPEADPTGATDSSAALLSLLTAAAGRPVTLEGTFYLAEPVVYTGKVTLIGKGKTSRILCDGVALQITDGIDSVVDNIYLENITAPWIITRTPANWSATMTPTQSNGNGYQPTVNDTDIWGSLTTAQKNQDIGPQIKFLGNATNVTVSRIYGRFVQIKFQGGTGCTVRDCDFRAGKVGIEFWNIDAIDGSLNKILNNRVTYASFNGIMLAKNFDGSVVGNVCYYGGESGVKTYQGTVGANNARCYRMKIEGNRCCYNYYDGLDLTADNPRTGAIDTNHSILNNWAESNRRTGFYGDGANNTFRGNKARENGLSGIKLYYNNSFIVDNTASFNNVSNTANTEHELVLDGTGNTLSNNLLQKGGAVGYGIHATGTNYVAINRTTNGINYFGASPTATRVKNLDNNGLDS